MLVGYNNDNPFVSGQVYGLWRHFLRGIPYYDLMLAYRAKNMADFRLAGAPRVHLLRSWFVPERNHPVELSPEEQEQYGSDVVFVGNYEPRGRLEWLEEVVKAGFNLRLFGPGKYWDRELQNPPGCVIWRRSNKYGARIIIKRYVAPRSPCAFYPN